MSGREYTERDIHMVLDGELPADELAGFDAWIAANPEMKARSGRFEADRARLRQAFAGILDEPAPERLSAMVSGEKAGGTTRRAALWRMAAAASLLLAGGLGGYLAGAGGLLVGAHAEDRLAEDAITAHVTYTADAGHKVEVGADDRDYLVGWLSKRTRLKIVAPDITSYGFQLLGGRLLPAGEHGAALLLYADREGNELTVYVTAEGGERAKGTYRLPAGGPSAVYWLDEGWGCAIVASLPEERLAEVARNAYRQLLEGAGLA